jgi:hypothetical protein
MIKTTLLPTPIAVGKDQSLDCDVLIVAAGFEERAQRFFFGCSFSPDAFCILVRFDRAVEGNREIESAYMAEAERKFKGNVMSVALALHDPRPFERHLTKALSALPRSHRKIWIDVSGMPSHAICAVLRLVREFRPVEDQVVVYTAAKDYVPTRAEFERLQSEQPEGVGFLKRAMALEMSDNYIPDCFSGHRSNEGRIALAVFAGYEVHRSAGVIENINPSILLLLYGTPGASELSWRLDLSKQLHSKFERSRRCAAETVSTLDVSLSLEVLERYYNFLYDDYDLTVAPVCSKMHSVAAYLFWERYKEVQLAFPLPVGYNPRNRPTGVGETYKLLLPPARLIHGALRS